MTTETNMDFMNWTLPGESRVERDRLIAQLEVYGETMLLRCFEEETAWVKPISADEMAHVFTQRMGFTSGLLPENAVWWNKGETGHRVALWRPPAMWRVALQREAFAPPARLRLPMPGLLFVCSPGRAPWAYAAPTRPVSADETLYRMPATNVFFDGRVCPGSHKFPDEVDRIPESFFESFFSPTGDIRRRSVKYPEDITLLWDELDGESEYPLDDLVPQCRVAEAMAKAQGGGTLG